jgi:hypothetical protein
MANKVRRNFIDGSPRIETELKDRSYNDNNFNDSPQGRDGQRLSPDEDVDSLVNEIAAEDTETAAEAKSGAQRAGIFL